MPSIYPITAISPSILKVMGLHLPEQTKEVIPIEKPPYFTGRICLMTIDSFGIAFMNSHSSHMPFLREKQCVNTIQSEKPYKTAVNLASMATGKPYRLHGVLKKSDRINLPTFLDIMKKCGIKTTLVCCRESSLHLLFKEKAHNLRTTPVLNDESVKEVLEQEIVQKNSEFIWAHFMDIDKISHRNGTESPETIKAAIRLDTIIQHIAALCNRNGYMLILNADHGHHTEGEIFACGVHNGSSTDDIYTPFIKLT